MGNIYNNSSYNILKNLIINNELAQLNLEDFKRIFRNDIRSNRNMDRINTVKDLIDCLERNDSLSETSIEPLREIACQCGGDLERAIGDYVAPRDTAIGHNIYREQRLSEEFRDKLEITGQERNGNITQTAITSEHDNFGKTSTPHDVTTYEKKRTAVYKLISRDIGMSWRSLGRELDISQGTMDAVEVQYPHDLCSRVHKMLQVFEEDETHDPNRRILTLCRALDSCRRKELRRKVEDIMSY
uniref:Death domain-containing protein n=1 Tax=Glossina brevipalpis TaxID=37001 RepID=A0A1A9W4C5_9MUSC